MWVRVIGTIIMMNFVGIYSSTDKLPAFVSGGHRVDFSTVFPWHVGLYTTTTSPYKQICGGTVVARDVVITAAHCISRDIVIPPAARFAVAAGKIYRPWNDPNDKEAQKCYVKEIKIPPRYQGSAANFQEDIALLLLTKKFEYTLSVQPACVSFNHDFAEAQLKEGQVGKVVGWGLKGENSEASQVLQAAALPSVSIEKCIEQSPAGFRSAITGDKICAGYNNGTAVCRGDSGGGLVFFANWLHIPLAFLRGVVSTSPTSQNKCNIYTWATFTNLLKHEHFIKSVVPDIEKACDLPAAEIFFGGTGSENDCCSCKCTRPHEVEYEGKKFSIHL